MLTSVPFCPPTPHLVSLTDAFAVGLGASFDNWTLHGLWLERESLCHINIFEMRTVEIMLLQKRFKLARRVVRLLSDNISVVFYLNKQDGTRSCRLTTVAEQVLRLAELLDIVLQEAHIRGEQNVLADILSRQRTVLKAEWRLSRHTFLWVSRMSP